MQQKGFAILPAILLIAVLLIIFLISILLTNSNAPILNIFKETPPACSNNSGNTMGGCFGKNLNKNFTVKGNLPSCLNISSHTCQGATIEVEDLCPPDTKITVGGVNITQRYSYLLFLRDSKGHIVPVIKQDPYPYPQQNENIDLQGSVNDKNFSISYTITPALCQ